MLVPEALKIAEDEGSAEKGLLPAAVFGQESNGLALVAEESHVVVHVIACQVAGTLVDQVGEPGAELADDHEQHLHEVLEEVA